MYLCICCDITQKDLDKNPEFKKLIGSVCGKCISDGGDPDFDRACEDSTDNPPDTVSIK